MKFRIIIFFGMPGIGATAARSAESTLPVETARLAESPLPGYALATALCYTCHSVDYVLYQPPATSRVSWQTSMTKMQKTFGAPIPDSAMEPLVDYLVKAYGAEHLAAPAPSAARPAAEAGKH